MGIDFDKLNEMVESISNVITDVEKEIKNIDNDIKTIREIEYKKVYSDLKKCAEISCKGLGDNGELYVVIDELDIKLRFVGGSVGMFVKGGSNWLWTTWLHGINNTRYMNQYLKDDNNGVTRLIESWDVLGDIIMERFAQKLQEAIKIKADNAHNKLNEAKQRAFELGYMSVEEM